MQQQRFDGSSELTDHPTADQLLEALDRLGDLNESVSLHAPGSEVKDEHGRTHIVDSKGRWRLVQEGGLIAAPTNEDEARLRMFEEESRKIRERL